MAAPIAPIVAPRLIDPSASTRQAAPGFSQLLHNAIAQVAQSSSAADNAVQNYLAGGSNQELHSTILATQKASVDFELLLQVRNKVVSAYEEIMRMQI